MDDFRTLAKILKKEFPDVKVSIRRIKMAKGSSGYTDPDGKDKFIIKINKECEHQESLDTLVHEFSHCLCYDEKDFHSVAWAKAYAKVYDVYLKKFVNEEN